MSETFGKLKVIISREEAKRLGLRRYFTGEPCIKGHVCERKVANYACVRCRYENERRRTGNPGSRQRRRALPRPDNCYVCDAPGRTVFDHCHKKGHFRGWLCNNCNTALGFAKDDPTVLRKLADYLELDEIAQ